MINEEKKISDTELVKTLKAKYHGLKSEIAKIIVGQDRVIEQVIISILSKGHCLLIGVPGLAKTLLVKTLSEALDLKFSRIQFTPDLMPSDITGTEIFDSEGQTGKKFQFIKGPVFANMILADEINRTPPKTQSALLEAMQEHKITAAGTTYTLDEPFFVLATQNPIEQEGTYPLPEAQLDRFMFNVLLDYPEFMEEIEVVKRTTSMYEPVLSPVFSKKEIIEFQELVRKVPVSDEVISYSVSIASKSRPGNSNAPKFIKDYVSWGAGPRASQYLILGAKALSIIDGRYSPSVEDIRRISGPVLRHRILMNFNAEADNIKAEEIIKRLFEN
ncbi:MAG: MoxR family ATPase [Ignavibacteriae bacterium]|jgi:MoxR-like ATPase|nr:MoxR family ATPase [Ignavibacteriota bacterium]